MNKKMYSLAVFAVFTLAFLLRFAYLSEVPNGLQQDETSLGYNAYSVLMTGKDEYGTPYPLYFKAFGEYKLPGYIYLSIPSLAILGVNEFSIRFLSALTGSLTVIVFFFFILSLTKDKYLALIASFLLAINPWHLHFSRGAFEVTPALFFITLGAFLFVLSVKMNRWYLLLLSILSFGGAVYTYNIARLLAPALLILLIYLYWKEFRRNKTFVSLTITAGLLVFLPYIFSLFSQGGFSSTKGTLITSSAVVQSALLEFRSYFIDLPLLLNKLLLNQWVLTSWKYLENLLSYFSVQFLFLSGSPHGNHGIGTVGQFYVLEFVTIIVGVVNLLTRRNILAYLFIGWFLLTIIIASLTREAPHATRSFFLIIPLIVFSAFGAINIWQNLSVQKKSTRLALVGLVILFGGYNLFYYFGSYYKRFPIAYAKSWRQQDKALSLYIKENERKYNTIIFDTDAGFIYTSLVFFTQFSPLDFQHSAVRQPDDSEGMSEVSSFGKYTFKDVDWGKDYPASKTLYITNQDRKPKNASPIKVFNYPKRPVVVSVKQDILQYPVEETAYVVIASE